MVLAALAGDRRAGADVDVEGRAVCDDLDLVAGREHELG